MSRRRCTCHTTMCIRLMDTLFDDKRIITVLLILWLCIVITIFEDIGLMNTQFMTIGPSNSTLFMGMVLNTQYKWGLVAGFTFVNTAVNDFVSDALSPWILNTITDHKTRFIPYPKWVCFLVTQIWSVYCNIMSVFSIFLAMSQIDFVLIRMAADLTVNAYTTNKFMRNKSHCPEKYKHISDEGHEKGAMCESELTSLKASDREVNSCDLGSEHPTSDKQEGDGGVGSVCSACRAAMRCEQQRERMRGEGAV